VGSRNGRPTCQLSHEMRMEMWRSFSQVAGRDTSKVDLRFWHKLTQEKLESELSRLLRSARTMLHTAVMLLVD
jgi:hypothetical protein